MRCLHCIIYTNFINNKLPTNLQAEKVVVLEDLASRFRLKTQAVINRVTALQEDGTLTGDKCRKTTALS